MATRENNRRYQDELQDGGEEEGLDAEKLRELLGFVARAPRRRPWLAMFVFVLVAALGIFVAVVIPRTYNAQAKLLAQSNLIVPALSNPNRAVPRDADNPTRNVGDMILRHDNLVDLVKETDLVARYYAKQSPVLKLKDRLLGGAATDEDRLRAIVGTLEKKLTVTVNDSEVTIAADWDDPQVACDLVSTVQKNFLGAKYDNQVAIIEDAISVLQQHAEIEAQQVDAALADYQKIATEVLAVAPAAPLPPGAPVTAYRPRARGGPRPGAIAVTSTGVAPDLAAALEAKRNEVKTLESARQQQLEAVKTQLAQAELTLTPQHPTVIALQQKLDALKVPDPQLEKARADEQALMMEIAPPPVPAASASASAPVAQAAAPTAAPAPVPTATAVIPGGGGGAPWDVDARTQLAHSKLEAAIRRYQDAMALIDQAKIELDVSKTAFKYRYTVVSPAEVPRSTKKPVVPLIFAGSIVLALLLAFLSAAMADRASGRIFEAWQVRRRLDLEVLGEFEHPQLPAEGP